MRASVADDDDVWGGHFRQRRPRAKVAYAGVPLFVDGALKDHVISCIFATGPRNDSGAQSTTKNGAIASATIFFGHAPPADILAILIRTAMGDSLVDM